MSERPKTAAELAREWQQRVRQDEETEKAFVEKARETPEQIRARVMGNNNS